MRRAQTWKNFSFFFFTMWCWIHIKQALKLHKYWGRQSTREKTEISHHLHWSHSSAVTCAKLKVWWLAEPTVPEIAGRVCFSLKVDIELWWNCENMMSESECLYSNSTLCALWENSLCEIWTHVKSFFAHNWWHTAAPVMWGVPSADKLRQKKKKKSVAAVIRVGSRNNHTVHV